MRPSSAAATWTNHRVNRDPSSVMRSRQAVLFCFVTQGCDISTDQDIQVLVDSFYEKVNRDELLGPIFNEVAAVDWAEHLPTMYRFWSSVLFRSNTYRGQPWPKHAVLPVNSAHFARWLTLFKQTVDEHFEGPKALEAKSAAASIADTFQNRFRFATAGLRIIS